MNITLFSRHEFRSAQDAERLFSCMRTAGTAFVPSHFGAEEPRSKFDIQELESPNRLLVGEEGGGLVLKGKAFSYALFNWGQGRVSCWEIYIRKTFMKRARAGEQLVGLVTELMESFDVIFALVTPQEDWDAKHISVEELPEGGRISSKVGWDDSLGRCLPGIYWVTCFGKTLKDFFGPARLSRLPIYQARDVGNKGIVLVLRDSPTEPELEERLQHDREVMATLGGEYFFDIDSPQKVCQPIPGVIGGGAATQREGGSRFGDQDNAIFGEMEAFMHHVPVYPGGAAYEHPRELAEGLIVYLHSEVKELFKESRESLVALDSYFEKHAPREEFVKPFLRDELVPALGGYLGKIIVKQLGGRWIVRKPILMSGVVLCGEEVAVFREAFCCIFAGRALHQAFDMAASGR